MTHDDVGITLYFTNTRGRVAAVADALGKRWQVTSDVRDTPIDKGAAHADEAIEGHLTVWYPGRREDGHREVIALLAAADPDQSIITGGDIFKRGDA